jgi:hypothetical protein
MPLENNMHDNLSNNKNGRLEMKCKENATLQYEGNMHCCLPPQIEFD